MSTGTSHSKRLGSGSARRRGDSTRAGLRAAYEPARLRPKTAHATNARATRSPKVRFGTTASTQLAKSASAEAKRAPKTTSPSSDRATVRATAGVRPPVPTSRRLRPNHGRPRSEDSGQLRPASTNPERVTARVTATRNTAMAATTQSRAIAGVVEEGEGYDEQQAQRAWPRRRTGPGGAGPTRTPLPRRPRGPASRRGPGPRSVIVAPARTPTSALATTTRSAAAAGRLRPEGPEERVHAVLRGRGRPREGGGRGRRRAHAAGTGGGTGRGHEGLLGGSRTARGGAAARRSRRGRVGEAQGAAVELGHPARDGQAEAGAALRSRRCRTAGTRARGRPAGTPGPWSTTSSHQWSSVAPAVTCTGCRPGLWRPALSRAFTSSCRSRAGSALHDEVGRDRDVVRRRPSRVRHLADAVADQARPGRRRGARAG